VERMAAARGGASPLCGGLAGGLATRCPGANMGATAGSAIRCDTATDTSSSSADPDVQRPLRGSESLLANPGRRRRSQSLRAIPGRIWRSESLRINPARRPRARSLSRSPPSTAAPGCPLAIQRCAADAASMSLRRLFARERGERVGSPAGSRATVRRSSSSHAASSEPDSSPAPRSRSRSTRLR
jgi:hypothetical protein